ncbi:MAG: hypothetical protein JO015_05470 [Verrucomicrobia bacterium]|nr:hypothetical protein [Verrucomicrobiota bacterium]
MEQISQLVSQLSTAPRRGTSPEEVSLLTAYLELARIIMDRSGVQNNGDAASLSTTRLVRRRTDASSSYLQNPALRLRQP